MNKNLNDFFLQYHGWYLIILISIIILLIIIWRIWNLKRFFDNVIKIQAPELRDKFIILRDQYEVKTLKNIVNNSSAIVIGVHRVAGQKDDFKLLSSFFEKSQLSFLTFDRRGNGKNQQDWQFKSLATDINDLQDVIMAVKNKYPHQKIILFGESLGAALASYAAKNNKLVNGLILSNLITKRNLFQFSFAFLFRFIFGFIFNKNIQLPIYINCEDISSNKAYITNVNQRYSNRQKWTLRFLWQFKKINQSSPKIIVNLLIPTLILQSGDDVFSDFHQLKVNAKRWKKQQTYHFLFEGKHALINEPNINHIFKMEIIPWKQKK